ncbi:unnamed protein product [Brassica oleracea]
METWTTWTMTPRSCVVTQSIAAKAVWLRSTLGTLVLMSDDLLNYIAVRSTNLRSLRLLMCDTLTDEGFMEAVVKLPLLEHLEVSYCSLSEEDFLKAAGQSCPNLKTLKLNSEPQFKPDDDEALAIAETMPGLRHLQLFGNGLTNKGLNAILDACPHLVHLDIRKCLRVDFDGDMAKRCL